MRRQTVVIKAVNTILEKATKPLTVQQILEALAKKDLLPNKTTVYRILEKLCKDNKVTEISVKHGACVYERNTKSFHYHFVCTLCHDVFCLKSKEKESEVQSFHSLFPSDGFRVHDQEFNLYGVCAPCSA